MSVQPKIVYYSTSSQTICWMGLFFAPLLSAITTLKLFCIFYLRLWYLKFLCKPSKSVYKASRTSSYLKLFLLISFICSFVPLAYIIGQHIPSNACGPFKGRTPDFYTGVVVSLIQVRSELKSRNFKRLILIRSGIQRQERLLCYCLEKLRY